MQRAQSRPPVTPRRPVLPPRRLASRRHLHLLRGTLLAALAACTGDRLPTPPAGPAALTGSPAQGEATAGVLSARPRLTLIDLGTLPGSASSRAFAINARGDVVGASSEGVEHAFLWTANGGFVDLGTLGGTISYARGINARGDIVGTSTTATQGSHAVLWRDGRIIDLGVLPGFTFSAAEDISNSGIIVGNTDGRGFVWTAATGMRTLPPLPGFDESGAFAVNERGDIVGFCRSVSGTPKDRATLWSLDGTATAIPLPPGTDATVAVDINAKGEVVVNALAVEGFRGVAFVWSRHGGFVEVDALEPGGRTTTTGNAISERGEVVGSSDRAGATHAFVWSAEQGSRDLGTLDGADLSEAFDVNERGEIVGTSYVAPIQAGVPFHAVLWQPRPAHD